MNEVQKDLFPVFPESIRWDVLTGLESGILIAISGGPDSVALCDLLLRTGEIADFRTYAAHLNHGIRDAEADADENFVREFCRARKIPLEVEKIDVKALMPDSGQSLEMAARTARYGFLGRVAARLGISIVATGHNANDRIENLFMRLLRGSGGKGLGALQPVRYQSGITFIRPMLGFFRSEIIDYLESRNLGYRIDSTNLDPSTDRGKIRNILLPKIVETATGLGWQSVMDSLGRSAELLSEDEAVLQEIAGMYEGGVKYDEIDCIHFDSRTLSDLPAPIIARIILASIERLDPSLRPERIHIDRIIEMLRSIETGPFDIPGGLRVETAGDDVMVHFPAEAPEKPDKIEICLDQLPVTVQFGPHILTIEVHDPATDRTHTGVELSQDGMKMAVSDVCNRIIVRSGEEGDRIKPLGMKGHSRKISDIFIDLKIPRYSRALEPLIVDGPSGEILGIPRLKIVSEKAKLTNETYRALLVTVKRG